MEQQEINITSIDELKKRRYELAIPNREVWNLFKKHVLSSFKVTVRENTKMLNQFCNSLLRGEAQKAEEIFREYLTSAICIRDTHSSNMIKQQYYNDILFSVLDSKAGWTPYMNRNTDGECTEIYAFIDGPNSETGIYIEIRYELDGSLDTAYPDKLHRLEAKKYTDLFELQCVKQLFVYSMFCNCKKVVCFSTTRL